MIRCLDCKADGPIGVSMKEQVKLWNTRKNFTPTLQVSPEQQQGKG
jgi:hypothetical protein